MPTKETKNTTAPAKKLPAKPLQRPKVRPAAKKPEPRPQQPRSRATPRTQLPDWPFPKGVAMLSFPTPESFLDYIDDPVPDGCSREEVLRGAVERYYWFVAAYLTSLGLRSLGRLAGRGALGPAILAGMEALDDLQALPAIQPPWVPN